MFKASPQQEIYYDWIVNGSGSCVLNAVAGAGKTSSLVRGVELMKGTKFFGAYNKKIADEIANRLPKSDDLVVSTMHAAGFRAWLSVAKSKLDGDKVRNIFREVLIRNPTYSIFQTSVIKLVSLAKQSGFGIEGFPSPNSSQSWLSLINHYDVEVFDEYSGTDNTEIIMKLARKTLQESVKQNISIIDFDDMIYAPLLHGCSFRKYDWIMLDEAQDTNATRRELALRMMKPTSRLVAVGDPHQAIYGFTGADSNSLELIRQATNAVELPLTVSFRCPKSVVAYAQQWVNHIQAAETASEGTVRFSDSIADAQAGDAVLCRFNAPLVEFVYKLISDGKAAKIEGREIGNGLVTLASKWKVKSIDAFTTRLDAYREREVAKFMAKEQTSRANAVEDKCNCLEIMVKRVAQKNAATTTPVQDIIAEINSIFSDTDGNNNAVIILSSIHKSKGREWKRVFWIQTGANARATMEWMMEQENNLNYVAATRSMDELIICEM